MLRMGYANQVHAYNSDYIAIVWYHQIDTQREHQTLLEELTSAEDSYKHLLMIQTM